MFFRFELSFDLPTCVNGLDNGINLQTSNCSSRKRSLLLQVWFGCVEKWDGDAGTGDTGTWRLGDLVTRGRGDSGTRGRIFTICLNFHHISQNPRLLIVTALYPGFKFLICTM